MLNPNNDRLDYGQIIAPPVDYKLDFAIGTTYSLDLDALVGACIALGLAEETDSDLMKNPICLLEALRATGDKIALFCEGGQIHLPNNVTSLYILLEKMVFTVETAQKRGLARYPSFHPKFWLVKYVNNEGEVLYRVVVLSRNLTFDRSWDVSFCMEGRKVAKRTAKNNPVIDFISYLINQLTDTENASDKQAKMQALAQELKNVKFDLDSKEFYDFDFIPVGINNKYSSEQAPFYNLFEDSFHEVMIMSPFLSKSVIEDFNERNKNIEYSEHMLITRASELGKLKPADCSNFDIYTMKDAVVDGESLISEENASTQKQDIHAKIYMVRKYSDSYLYLGSLNASHNALNGNIEFMVKLWSKNRYLNLSKLKASIFGEDEAECPFQSANLSNAQEEEADEKTQMLDSIIKAINRLEASAIIKENGDRFDINLSFEHFESEYDITVSPLLSNKTAPLSESIIFSSMELTQLSEFYKISVYDDNKSVSRVIMIPTENMPADREKAVVSSVVNDKSCFCRYIAFLLGDNMVISALESDNSANETNGTGKTSKPIQLPALYEKMLKTAATAPERFKEIEYLIKSVSGDGVIPEGFEELYNTFRKVVKM
jgi:hypothetical protein